MEVSQTHCLYVHIIHCVRLVAASLPISIKSLSDLALITHRPNGSPRLLEIYSMTKYIIRYRNKTKNFAIQYTIHSTL